MNSTCATHGPRCRRTYGAVAALVVAALLLVASTADAQPYASIRIETAAGGDAPSLGPLTLAAGDTLRAHAAAYDSTGAYWGEVVVDWSVVPARIDVEPAYGTSALLHANQIGTCQVHAQNGLGLDAWSGTLTIVPGPPARVAMFAAAPNGIATPLAGLDVTADSTLVLYAGAYDGFSNWIGPLEVTWSLDAPLGTVTPARASLTVLAGSKAGSGSLRLDAPGLPRVEIPLLVRAGRLARLAIGLQPDGPALADTTLAVGAALDLHAIAFDARDNRITPAPAVDWSTTGSPADVLPPSGTWTTLRALAPGSTRAVARLGAASATTGIVQVTAGALARLRLSRQPDAYAPLGTTTLDADQWLELFALGEDAAGHALGPVAADWRSSDPTVVRPAAASGTSALVDPMRVGTARISIARSGALPDTSGALTVIPGRMAQLRIETLPDGRGTEIAGATLSADSSLVLCAVGRDADGNFTGGRDATWAVSGGIGTLSAPAGSTVVLDASHTGTGLVTAIDFLLTDATGPIEVLPGMPHRLHVEDASGAPLGARVLRPGETLAAVAGQRDADGNALGSPAARWSWSGDALAPVPASEQSGYTWTASGTGRGRLVVEAAGVLPDTSGWISVISGAIARLEIHDASGASVADRTLSADSLLALRAVAFDQAGNALGDVVANWSLDLQGGSASAEPRSGSGTLLRPDRAGDVLVLAAHASGLQARTGRISIAAGSMARVEIETASDGSGLAVGGRALLAGESLQLYAVGRDAHANFVGPADAGWIVEGGIGRLEPSFGSATLLTAERAGNGAVRAVHALLPGGRTGPLVVSPGNPARLAIETAPGDPAQPLSGSTFTADDSLLVFAALRDAFGNRVADATVTWSLVGDAAVAEIAPRGPATSTWFLPRHPGSVRLHASGSGFEAESGPLAVAPGRMARVAIETAPGGSGGAVGDRSLAAGERLALHAVGRDRHGNFVAAADVRWLVEGTMGRVDIALGPQARFLAERPGSGRVAALHEFLPAARTGDFLVHAGPPAVLQIEPAPGDPADPLGAQVLTADDSLSAFAVVRDSLGNLVGPVAAAWSLVGDPVAARISPAALADAIWFVPLHPGSLLLQASWNGLRAESGALTIVPGRLAVVRVETAADGGGVPIGDRSLAAGETLVLHAVGRDARSNFVTPVDVQWRVEGDIGRVASGVGTSTTFLAERAGTGSVVALHARLAAAATGDLSVRAGSPAVLAIERTPGDPADPQGSAALSSDDSLQAFAVLRDSLGNVVGAAPASWSLIGDASAAELRTGGPANATWLLPRHPGNVRLHASWQGYDAEAGPFAILAGRMANLGIESAADGSGAPVGDRALAAGEALALHAVGRDADANYVGPASVRWSAEGDVGWLEGDTGPATRFVATRPGVGKVSAVHEQLGTARTGALAVAAGTPAVLRLERTPGDPLDPLDAASLTADDSLQAFAVLRDSLGNAIGAAAATWNVVGDSTAALVSTAGPSGASWLLPRHPAVVRLRASWNGFAAESGWLGIRPGRPAGEVAVEVAPESLRADARSRARVTAGPILDRHGNRVEDGTRVDLQSDAGTFDATGDLEAGVPGLQLATRNGGVQATLTSPAAPATGEVRVAAGNAPGAHPITFLPVLEIAVVPGSFVPAVALRGTPLATHVRVQSRDVLGSRIDTGALRFEDGNGVRFEARLASPLGLVAGGEAALDFEPLPVPLDLHPGSYAPEIELGGVDDLGQSFDVRLALGASSLRVVSGAAVRVGDRVPGHLTRGERVRFEVEVLNTGDSDALLDPARCALRNTTGGFTAELDSGIDLALGAGELDTLRFLPTVWPADALVGASPLALVLGGSQPGGDFASALPVVAVEVQSPAALAGASGSLSPGFAPVGSTLELRLRVHNAGGSGLVLGLETRLWVAGREAALASPVAIEPDSICGLDFAPLPLAGLPPGRLPVVLAARGVQNGSPFAQDLALADSLLLFAPASFAIVGVQASQPTVTRAQTEPWDLGIVVLNTGQSRYRIDAAEVHIVLGGIDRTATYALVSQQALGSLLDPASADTLRFRVLRTGDDTGLATLEANVRAVDVLSGQTFEANTYRGGRGSVRVELPAAPVAGPLRLTQTAVSAGQSRTVDARLEVRNDGEAVLDLDLAQLAASLVTQPSVPVHAALESGPARLAPGDRLTLRYVLGPFEVPPGRIALAAAPRLVETNRGFAMSVDAAETLLVQTPAAPAVTGGDAPALVTRGQARPWTARFTVRNAGESRVRLQAPRLAFRPTGPGASDGFAVSSPLAFDGAGDLDLGGGATGDLSFTVAATDTVARELDLVFASAAVEINSGRVLQVEPGTPLRLRVQREPAIVLLDSTLAPRVASRDQRIEIAIAARNDGEATLHLDAARTSVRLAAGASTAALANAVSLEPGQVAELRFLSLPVDAPAGGRAVLLQLEGIENGNPYAAPLRTLSELWVDAASSLEILAVRASQAVVTSGQARPWNARVALRNHGATATLESTSLLLSLGAEDVSDRFAVRAPARFESGRTTLAPGAADTLRFEVERTAGLEGLVVLDARLRATDTNSGASLDVESAGSARGSVRITSPCRPTLAAVVPSQAQVSEGQSGDWLVHLTIRNAGGSAWRPDWTTARLQVGEVEDDSVLAPAGFDDPAPLLGAGESAGATFRIARTGAEPGTLALAIALAGVQETDGCTVGVAPGAAVSVRVQSPARARLEPLRTLLPRAPAANTGQELPVVVEVANAGQADLAACQVRVQAHGATPAETLLALPLAGGSRATLQPRFRCAATPGPVTLDAALVLARDANDSSRTDSWIEPLASRLELRAELPGGATAVVEPSQARVSAGQTSPWWVTVRVANEGEEPLLVASPRAADLDFRCGGLEQEDYVVVPPDSLAEGGLELAGGAQGTLRYRVARTGSTGGTVSIGATLSATHANDPAAAPATAAAQVDIAVDAEPGVRVLATESITWRRQHGRDDFRVDAGQSFTLRVVLENTGGTYLDSVRVQVENQRGNSRVLGPALLPELAPGQRGEIELPVVAGSWLSEPGLPETFVAHIVAARDRNSGLSVLSGAAVDNTSFAYVESPAQLDLGAWIESPAGAQDGVLSTKQEFVLASRVENRGGAAVSESGRVQLVPPAGFELVAGNAETFFVAGETVRWTLRAPASAIAETLVTSLAAIPQDQNDGEPARVLCRRQALPVEVRDTGALAASLALAGPEGALDGRLSCRQAVDLEIHSRGDTGLVDRQAEMLLPPNWSMLPGQTAKRDLPPDPESSLVWTVLAGPEPGPVPVVLRVTARDQNDGSTRVAIDTLVVHVERGTRLSLAAAIVSPEEARDGRMLPGVTFRLRARVRNQGEAAAAPGAPHGSLRLVEMPAGYTVDSPLQSFTLGVQGAGSADWLVTSPSGFRPEVETLTIAFETLPRDANSGAAADVDPDSSVARCLVSLSSEAVQVETASRAAALAVPGARRLPLLEVRIANQTDNAVSLDSLGVQPLQDGVLAERAPFARFHLVREDVASDTLVVAPPGGATAWIVFPASGGWQDAARLAPRATATWTLLADISPDAPARGLGVSLRPASGGAPLLRAIESGSRTPVPVRADARASLASESVRVLEPALVAYNAPNPFHVGRETTTIRYPVGGTSEVRVRIYTLHGVLVWEAARHEEAAGPDLRGLVWDGRNGAGEAVRNGVYVCDVRVGARVTRFQIAVVR